MKIARVESWKESVALSLPYTIAFKTIDAVELIFVRLTAENGLEGVGSAHLGQADHRDDGRGHPKADLGETDLGIVAHHRDIADGD